MKAHTDVSFLTIPLCNPVARAAGQVCRVPGDPPRSSGGAEELSEQIAAVQHDEAFPFSGSVPNGEFMLSFDCNICAVPKFSPLCLLAQDSLAAEIEGTMRKELQMDDPDVEEQRCLCFHGFAEGQFGLMLKL